ncbi:MAG: SURF1 family protein [Pseudomonadota bacterium]
MRIAFRFKWIPFVATALLVALGVSLGQWQQRRADEKTALEARLAAGNAAAPLLVGEAPVPAAQAEFRRVRMTGTFVRDWPLYLDNRPYQGRAGFYLLMPFKVAGSGMHVLVARGWLPRNMAERDKLPDYGTPSGTVTLEGVARLGVGHVMQLGSAPPLRPGAIVQNADVAQVAAGSGLALQAFIVEQGAPAGPDDTGLVHDWPAPASGVDKHRGYAFQWYGLAAMAFLFFVVTGFRRGK